MWVSAGAPLRHHPFPRRPSHFQPFHHDPPMLLQAFKVPFQLLRIPETAAGDDGADSPI